MDTEPQGESEIPEVPHRRRRMSVWQKTPKGVKISVAVCLALLAISLATGNWIIEWSQNRFASKPSQPVEPAKNPRLTAGKAFDEVATGLRAFDLELSGTALNRVTRRIEGTVTNKSQRTYTNIKITFALPSSDLVAQDQTTVTVSRLAPQGRAKFASDVLPNGVHQWALINTTATPAATPR
jgi:hypothetical protein